MKSLTVFISYSHRDEAWKDRLVTHLGVLQSDGFLDLWDDRKIRAGGDWQHLIEAAINQAAVAILLVTANFLTSDFILKKEVPLLLQRRESEGLCVFPVIVKPCVWQKVKWLSKMQVRPKDGRALSAGNENKIDADLASITQEISSYIDKFLLDNEVEELDKNQNSGYINILSIEPYIKEFENKLHKNYVLETSLSLFNQHLIENFMRRVKEILNNLYDWDDTQSNIAAWVIEELADNAFLHGCQGHGELVVSIFVHLENNGESLIVRVKSPGNGFNLNQALQDASNSSIKSGLWQVNKITEKLISSSDGLMIQANILRNRSILNKLQFRENLSKLSDKRIDILELRWYGRVDSNRAPKYQEIFDNYIVNINCIAYIINFKEVDYISSAGLRIIIKIFKLCKKKSKHLYLVNMQDYILEVLNISGFDSILEIYDSVKDAIESIKNITVSDNSRKGTHDFVIETIDFGY